MSKAIQQTRTGLTFATVNFGWHGESRASHKQAVHDGDTITCATSGNFGIRFLGIDTPEVSFQLPNTKTFTSIANPAWDAFLNDPFDPVFDLPERALNLSAELGAHLLKRVGEGCAANHAQHAAQAQRLLEENVAADMATQGLSKDDFQLFLAFAFEVMDGYGRLLAFVNAHAQDAAMRPELTYNERQLADGAASPYFIWPNIDPFRKAASLRAAVFEPGTAKEFAQQDRKLRRSRESIKTARANHQGIYSLAQPLRIEPFELRFLAQRRAPNRWVIDLSRNDNRLIPPEEYYDLHSEDRLFIPEHFVPLFEEKGWLRG